MIEVEEAIRLVKENISVLKAQSILVEDSLGYVLAEDVCSPIDMPPFPQSAMDGYAINKGEARAFKLVGEVQAGSGDHPVLNDNEAVRIFTGAAVPLTANVVAQQEIVEPNEDQISLTKELALGANIRLQGEQIKQGDIALRSGTPMTPASIGFLLGIGVSEVSVFAKPSVKIIVTGDELVAPGGELTYGKIYESNSYMLKSLMQEFGLMDVEIIKVKDDYDATYTTIKEAIANCDLMLLSGGISVGDYDFVGKALNALGANQIFYKVKQKPGKPLYFGALNETKIFALPGNPAAALTCSYVYVKIAIDLMMGLSAVGIPNKVLTANFEMTKKGDRAQFLKVIATEDQIELLGAQSSAMLSSFSVANAFAYIPANVSEVKKGDQIKTYLFG